MAKAKTHPRKGYLALESAVRNFEPMDYAAAWDAAWTAQADHGKSASINGHCHGAGVNAGTVTIHSNRDLGATIASGSHG